MTFEAERNPHFKGRPGEYLEWWISKKNVAEFMASRLPLGDIEAAVDLTV